MIKNKVVPSSVLSQFIEEGYEGRNRELREAAGPLAEKLGIPSLALRGFTETTVIYQAPNGHYLRAGYKIERATGKVLFGEFADVRVDNHSLREESRSDIGKMMKSVLDENMEEAGLRLQSYLGRRKVISESNEDVLIPEPRTQEVVEEDISKKKLRRAIQESLGTAALFEVETVVGSIAKRLQLESNSMKNADEADQCLYGLKPVVQIELQTVCTRQQSEIATRHAEKRLEDVVTERRSMGILSDKEDFAKSVLRVKTLNATAELQQIGEAMSEVVTSAPELLYLSIGELAEQVRDVFTKAETSNWDEELCLDIAEGAQKLAANIFPKRIARISDAASLFWESDDELPEDKWSAYKEVSNKLFENIVKGERKLADANKNICETIIRLVPILKDEGFKTNNPEMTAVARTLQRYSEDIKSHGTLDKLVEVVNFVQDHILAEALQLDDEGNPPKDMALPNKGTDTADPNNIDYRNHPKDKLGPYGEPSQLLKETGMKEAWQLGDDGEIPTEARPAVKGNADRDPNADKPYRVYTGKIGYKKDADSDPTEEIDPEDMEEIKTMDDLLVPAGKVEALQLDGEGNLPKEAHPAATGDAEQDPNKLPYRTWDVKKPLGYIFTADEAED